MDLDRVNEIMALLGEDALRGLPERCDRGEIIERVTRSAERAVLRGDIRLVELAELFAVLAVGSALP
jgi:hypothetical protein